jgi:hypothetical protein
MLPIAQAYAATQTLDPAPRLMLDVLRASAGPLDAARTSPFDASSLAGASRDDGWLVRASLCAELCSRIRHREHAEGLLELLRPYAGLGIALAWIAVCTGSLARPLGVLAALLGRWSECDELFERALAYCTSLRAPALRALTELDYARALREHPRASTRRKRERLLASALSTSRELGLKNVAAAAEHEARLAR